MDPVPSIKGSVFSAIVEDIAKLVDRGEISREELAAKLEPEHLALLGQQIVLSKWYDIRAYDRMNAVLLEIEGGGDTQYFREQGRRTASRLLESGLYAQLEYLNRTQVGGKKEPQARFEAFGRDLRLLASLSGSILNFTHWTSKPDPNREHRYVIEVGDASAMPESLCWRSDGFVNGMAAMHGAGDLWGWRRERADLVVFHMLRSV